MEEKEVILFVDDTKAFDMVWREGQCYKLVKGNVNSKIINVNQSMYQNIKSCVMLNKEFSDTFVCNAGVRHWETLSAVLFSYYIYYVEEELLNKNSKYIDFFEDFANKLIKILLLMYADDMVIMCDSEEEMRRVLLTYYSYSNE